MRLPYPQKTVDWLTQFWNLVCGKPVDMADELWRGPTGLPGVIDGALLKQLAEREQLVSGSGKETAGLLESFAFLGTMQQRLDSEVEAFYLRTGEYELEVWNAWKPGWRFFSWIVDRIFARRIKQLSLPQDPLDTAAGMTSEVCHLVDAAGAVRYRFWVRRLKRDGRTVYVGSYGIAQARGGVPCIKVVFPLPYGSATVILRCEVEDSGALVLESAGRRSGDPGFYFLVFDQRGRLFSHFIRSFRERIRVYPDGPGRIRADHSMSLWGFRVFELHYRATRKKQSTKPAEPTR